MITPIAKADDWRWHVLAALIIGAYGAYLVSCAAPAISGPDDHGYWLQGRMLAEGRGAMLRAPDELQYVGTHWLETEPGRLVCRYPPGLAVLVALVTRCAGFHASYRINPCLAVLALVGVYLISCRLVSAALRLLPVLALVVLPVFGRHALFCDAHMPVTAALVWGVLCLLLTLPPLLLHAAYYWTSRFDALSTLRFLLPTFPLYVLAAVWLLEQVTTPAGPGMRRAGVATLVVFHCFWGGLHAVQETQTRAASKRALADLSHALVAAKVGLDDVVLADPLILNHLSAEGQCRVADPAFITDKHSFGKMLESENVPAKRYRDLARLRRVADRYSALSPVEWERAIAERMRASAGPHRIFVLGPQRSLASPQRPCWGPEYFAPPVPIDLARQDTLLDAVSILVNASDPISGAAHGARPGYWALLLRDPEFGLSEWTWPVKAVAASPSR